MTRLEQARHRAVGSKRALVVGSAAAFAVTTLLARAAHPGQAAHAQTSSSSATVVPQVSTHVS